mgnify:CR=1 FL=1
MSKAKTETKMDSFQSWAHRWGRVGTLIALIYMVALPFVVLAAYDSIPSLGEVFNVNTFPAHLHPGGLFRSTELHPHSGLLGVSGVYHRQHHEPEASGGGKRHEPDQKAAQHPGG